MLFRSLHTTAQFHCFILKCVNSREILQIQDDPCYPTCTDHGFIYHSGDERQIVGIAEITRAAYADPRVADPKQVVIDLKSRERLTKPVALAAVKARVEFADFALVRNARLSVMPVTVKQWKLLCAMAE